MMGDTGGGPMMDDMVGGGTMIDDMVGGGPMMDDMGDGGPIMDDPLKPPMLDDDFLNQMNDLADSIQDQNQQQHQHQQQNDQNIIDRLNRIRFIFTVED